MKRNNASVTVLKASFSSSIKLVFPFVVLFLVLILGIMEAQPLSQPSNIPVFALNRPEISLTRAAQPGTPFVQAGPKFVFIGEEGGSFEAWAYPLKLLRSFKFSFLLENSTQPIEGKTLVKRIEVTPSATILSFVHQNFTVQAVYFVPPSLPCGIILLQVDTISPLKIVCSFLPVLQPMWPAGLGGQYSYWDSRLHAYIISEPTGKNHAFIGSPGAEGISYTPAHMLAENPSEFIISISNPKNSSASFWPIIITGGKGKRQKWTSTYTNICSRIPSLYQKTDSYWQVYRDSTLSLKSPEEELNRAFEWAKISLKKLEVINPDLGHGLVAGLGPSGSSGRPGFGWFFGGDAYINSLGLTAIGAFSLVKTALGFTTKWQRSDGKMAHELSQAAGYINWWQDYPYGYLHADTTPYFLVALESYVKQSGDLEFLAKCWPQVVKAFEFCRHTDKNNDGLMDNREAGLGALEYGQLTNIQTDIYLAAIWIKALEAMKNLASWQGEDKLEAEAQASLRLAEESYLKNFWNDELKFFVYAFDPDGNQVTEISPWNSLGLMWRLGNDTQRKITLQRLLQSDLLTDWGVRSLATNSPYYHPLNYNYGAVWPFITGWLTTALFKNHLTLPAISLLESTASLTYEHALGGITEVYSGATHVWPQEAVPLQGFSSHGLLFPTIRGLLGLEGDFKAKKVIFHPQLPANWDKIRINNFKVGPASFNFRLQRENDRLVLNLDHAHGLGFEIEFSPCFLTGTMINQVTLDNQEINYYLQRENQMVWPLVAWRVTKPSHQIKIQLEPTVEIIPARFPSCVGSRNQGLKIINWEAKERQILLGAQGKAGHQYELPLRNISRIKKVVGATLKERRLLIHFTPSSSSGFPSKLITIYLK